MTMLLFIIVVSTLAASLLFCCKVAFVYWPNIDDTEDDLKRKTRHMRRDITFLLLFMLSNVILLWRET